MTGPLGAQAESRSPLTNLHVQPRKASITQTTQASSDNVDTGRSTLHSQQQQQQVPEGHEGQKKAEEIGQEPGEQQPKAPSFARGKASAPQLNKQQAQPPPQSGTLSAQASPQTKQEQEKPATWKQMGSCTLTGSANQPLADQLPPHVDVLQEIMARTGRYLCLKIGSKMAFVTAPL